MAKNRSAAGITNIVQYDANRNITFVSGSTTLLTVSSSGALTTTGTITAQTLVVQTVTSSVNFITGSTKFGSLIGNTHQFTGSVTMTGSLAVVTNGTELQVGATGVNIGNALTDSHVISGSVRINPNGLFISSSGNVGIGTTSPLGSATERTLHLSDGGAGFTTLYVTNGANTLRGIFAVANPTSTISIGTQTNTDFRIVTNDTERIRVTNGGELLINATSSGAPNLGYQLGVRGTNTNTQISIALANQTLSTQGCYIGLDGSIGYIQMIDNKPWTFSTNNTERMRINSSGEIGIGTTATSGNRFWIRGSSASGSDTSLFIQNSTPSTLFSVRNDGIVTKPLQPAFRAGRSTSYNPGANTPIVFNSTGGFGFNVGGHYSTSTGRFTAPISGVYNFTACVIWESVGNSQSMDDAFTINVNGSPAAYSFRRATYIANTTGIGGYYVDNATVLLNLTAGQYVEIFNRYNLTVHGNANYCYFNGYLVG